MSVRSIQLVKWSLPAFALIVGFFWYKRRRVDRVDPGGASKVVDGNRESKSAVDKRNQRSNLYDSGIHIDESYTLMNSSSSEESHCSPRRVSQSLDIPTRRSGSQQMNSSLEKEAWYDGIEEIASHQAIVLGSNPKSANFDMADSMRDIMAKKKQLASRNGDKKIVEEFANVNEEAEEEEKSSSVTLQRASMPEERQSPVNECIVQSESQSVAECKGQVICERDSANHSPVSGVLEGSVTDEVRSVGSTDSGKGGSIKGNVKEQNPATYEFVIPQALVGRIIGKRGSFLNEINTQAGVNVQVKRHPFTKDLKVCVINGPPDCIKTALKIIKQKFPAKKYPNISFEEVFVTRNPVEVPLVSELMHIPLVEGVNNDVIICHILKPSRLFVQLPTHPTYPSLRILDQNMTMLYDTVESPPVPDQLTKGMLVVAKWYGRWVRAYVEEPDPNGQQNLVRLVDHGGYWTFSNAEMRKIRYDYLVLPFQAIEVFLANIQPVDGEWKQEAYDVVAQICSGSIGQAQIEGYIDSNIYVSLYINIPKHGVISLADELVARGFAVPVTLEDVPPEEHIPTA